MGIETTNCILAISALISASATVAIVYFSNKTAKLAESNVDISGKIAWFTGAMETHSEKQLMLEAKKHDGLKILWWDPTIAKPPTNPKHGEPVDVSALYFYVPVAMRAGTEKKHL